MINIDELTSEKLKEIDLDRLIKLKSELDKTIDDIKKDNKQAFIDKVREDATKNDMSLAELIKSIKPPKTIKPPVKKPAKYQHPDDSSKAWSGYGKQPKWLTDLAIDGKTKDDFKI